MARPKKEWQEIRNRNVRFYVEKELDSRAWEILHSEEIKVYGSQNDFIIQAINDFYERHLKKKQDSYLETREKEDAFVDRIVKATEEKFAGKIPELLGMAFMQMQAQGVSFVPVVMQNNNVANVSSTVQAAIKDDEDEKEVLEELEDNEFLDFDFCG
ncbi:MAG: hypothetical protein IJX86_03145 [Lachnospiraceae bacterium]|nr:hypothetical protein [Lachnospiraceae bacterium]